MSTLKGRAPFEILLSTDGSEHSRAAIDLVCGLSLPPGSLVTLVAVLTPHRNPGLTQLLAAIEEGEELLRAKGYEVVPHILNGRPSVVLTEFGEHSTPDLVVLGVSDGLVQPISGLGMVAEQVVEYSCCPVLVVRAPFTGLRRVLLALDRSIYSQRALDYIRLFPLPESAMLKIVHVLEPSKSTRSQIEVESQARSFLAQALASLKRAGLQAGTTLKRGEAASAVLALMKSWGADLIVAGSRGEERLEGLLLGSVVRKLVHQASCSVLVVKTKENFAS